jgi:hypothetical protein
MSTKQKGHDYSTILIWAAALVTVVRYVAAFIASDMGEIPDGWLSDLITFMMGISGLGMGILDVIGGTYLFDGWRRAMPQTGKAWTPRFKVLTVFVFSLMATGVMILVPFTESRVTHTSMADVLGEGRGLTWWSFLVNVAPYLLVGGVAVGNQIVTTTQTNASANGERTANDSPNSSGRKFSTLTNSDKYLILNSDSKQVARELGVTARAIQKWRKLIQQEVSDGKL